LCENGGKTGAPKNVKISWRQEFATRRPVGRRRAAEAGEGSEQQAQIPCVQVQGAEDWPRESTESQKVNRGFRGMTRIRVFEQEIAEGAEG
jgi:hypothetical protein